MQCGNLGVVRRDAKWTENPAAQVISVSWRVRNVLKTAPDCSGQLR